MGLLNVTLACPPAQATPDGADPAVRPPVAGKRGEQGLPGDAVEGVNRLVGKHAVLC